MGNYSLTYISSLGTPSVAVDTNYTNEDKLYLKGKYKVSEKLTMDLSVGIKSGNKLHIAAAFRYGPKFVGNIDHIELYIVNYPGGTSVFNVSLAPDSNGICYTEATGFPINIGDTYFAVADVYFQDGTIKKTVKAISFV